MCNSCQMKKRHLKKKQTKLKSLREEYSEKYDDE